ncbi:MAG: outer membrane beta-barrel protein [Gemmatimonadales bacterium]
MSKSKLILTALAVAALATPAVGQNRAVVFQVEGGGYSHTRNLNATGADAHFNTGYSLGAAAGVQFNRFFALHVDATMARAKGLGNVAFVDHTVNRYFLGGHAEVRYPIGSFAPFVFGGAGAVIVDQQGPEAEEMFNHFTRAAGMFGAGVSFTVPGTPLEVLATGKALTYKWVASPFDRTQLDVTYALGFAYKFGF